MYVVTDRRDLRDRRDRARIGGPKLALLTGGEQRLTGQLAGSKGEVVTFTRATPKYASDGSGQAPCNYVLQSELDATWTTRGTTLGAPTLIAPNGTLTGRLVSGLADPGVGDFYYGNFGNCPAGPFTQSVYLYPTVATGVLDVLTGTSIPGRYKVDLSLLPANRWTRVYPGHPAVTMVQAFVADGASGQGFYFARFSGTIAPLGIWGCQAEPGLIASTYLRTTTAAVFTPCVESKGLLIEAAHTNTLLGSNDLAGIHWAFNIGTGITGTSNAATAPDGTLTASRIDLAQVATGGYEYQNAGTLLNAPYTLSVWLRAATSMNVYLSLKDVNSVYYTKVCAVTTAWQRFALTATPAAGGTYVVIGNNEGTNPALPIQSYEIWGAQLETGSYAHSLVVTAGAVATCNTDVASLPALDSAAAGSVSFDFTPLWSAPAGDTFLLNTRAVSGHNGFHIYVGANRQIHVGSYNGSSTTEILASAQTWTPGQLYRMRYVWGAGNMRLYRDGALLASLTNGSGVMPAASNPVFVGIFADGSTGPADGLFSNLHFEG